MKTISNIGRYHETKIPLIINDNILNKGGLCLKARK
jgi:hypothetical protein